MFACGSTLDEWVGQGDPLKFPYTLEVPVNKFYVVEIFHSLRTIDKLQDSSVPVTSQRKISPYQSHTLSITLLDVLHNVPVCHPLGDHGESGVRSVFPLADTDKPQDIRVIQRLP